MWHSDVLYQNIRQLWWFEQFPNECEVVGSVPVPPTILTGVSQANVLLEHNNVQVRT